jgi:hypothetical protein
MKKRIVNKSNNETVVPQSIEVEEQPLYAICDFLVVSINFRQYKHGTVFRAILNEDADSYINLGLIVPINTSYENISESEASKLTIYNLTRCIGCGR